jgi:hypothetical protein
MKRFVVSLLLLSGITQVVCAQKLAWTYDVPLGPGEDEVWMEENGNSIPPSVSTSGAVVLQLRWHQTSGLNDFQTGLIWLSSKGLKLAELRLPNSMPLEKILNVSSSEVCVVVSSFDDGEFKFIVKTFKLLGSTLTEVRSVDFSSPDAFIAYEKEPDDLPPSRADARGFFVSSGLQSGGLRISRYLY